MGLYQVQSDAIALDATKRKRPHDVSLPKLINYIHQNSATRVLGDISVEKDVELAPREGVDNSIPRCPVTLRISPQHGVPDFRLVETLAGHVPVSVTAEGDLHTGASGQNAGDRRSSEVRSPVLNGVPNLLSMHCQRLKTEAE